MRKVTTGGRQTMSDHNDLHPRLRCSLYNYTPSISPENASKASKHTISKFCDFYKNRTFNNKSLNLTLVYLCFQSWYTQRFRGGVPKKEMQSVTDYPVLDPPFIRSGQEHEPCWGHLVLRSCEVQSKSNQLCRRRSIREKRYSGRTNDGRRAMTIVYLNLVIKTNDTHVWRNTCSVSCILIEING